MWIIALPYVAADDSVNIRYILFIYSYGIYIYIYIYPDIFGDKIDVFDDV